MVTMAWSCYFLWVPSYDHAIFHDDHDMILLWSYHGEYESPRSYHGEYESPWSYHGEYESPWSYHGQYESPWSYHVMEWSPCLTMVVNPGCLPIPCFHENWISPQKFSDSVVKSISHEPNNTVKKSVKKWRNYQSLMKRAKEKSSKEKINDKRNMEISFLQPPLSSNIIPASLSKTKWRISFIQPDIISVQPNHKNSILWD